MPKTKKILKNGVLSIKMRLLFEVIILLATLKIYNYKINVINLMYINKLEPLLNAIDIYTIRASNPHTVAQQSIVQ